MVHRTPNGLDEPIELARLGPRRRRRAPSSPAPHPSRSIRQPRRRARRHRQHRPHRPGLGAADGPRLARRMAASRAVRSVRARRRHLGRQPQPLSVATCDGTSSIVHCLSVLPCSGRYKELGRRMYVMSTGIYNLRQSIGFRGRPVRCGVHVTTHAPSVRSAGRARSERVGRTIKTWPRALSPPRGAPLTTRAKDVRPRAGTHLQPAPGAAATPRARPDGCGPRGQRRAARPPPIAGRADPAPRCRPRLRTAPPCCSGASPPPSTSRLARRPGGHRYSTREPSRRSIMGIAAIRAAQAGFVSATCSQFSAALQIHSQNLLTSTL